MTEEVWKPIAGFPNYFVSDLGNVVRRVGRTSRALRGSFSKDGYRQVTLTRPCFQSTRKVHHLVLETFVGARPDGCECDHINGVPFDNRLENLHWVTRSENLRNPVTHPHLSQRRTRARAVLCVTTGDVFASITMAARELRLTRQSVEKVCLGQLNHTHGLHFRFVDAEDSINNR